MEDKHLEGQAKKVDADLNDGRIQRDYLGDGLYVEFDGFQFALIASDGAVDMDTVYLDPWTLASFLRYLKARGYRFVEGGDS